MQLDVDRVGEAKQPRAAACTTAPTPKPWRVPQSDGRRSLLIPYDATETA